MEEALAAARSILPPRERYAGVPEDLISGLQKRDLKHESAISQQLIDELGSALLPSFVFPLRYEQAASLMRTALDPTKGRTSSEYAEIGRELDAFVQSKIGDTEARRGFFVKLSFMSPKDIALRPTNSATVLQLQSRARSFWQTLNAQQRLFFSVEKHQGPLAAILLDSFYSALRVHSGREALDCIVSSTRCFEELSEGLIHREHFRTQIVVRPWMAIRPGFEFRVFVSNKLLTCASQYEDAFYPAVWDERVSLEQQISRFVKQQVIPKVSHRLPSFVCDVVQTEDGKFYVCELNPFASTTSACRFSWQEDRETLFVGPETWRFATNRSESPKMPQVWRDVIVKTTRPLQLALWSFVILLFVLPVLIAFFALHFL